MSRYPDHPDVQAAKGHPGKRRTKVEKQLADAESLASLMAAAPAAAADLLAPPLYLDIRFAPALAIWRDLAPRLSRINLLQPLDRHTFAMFCVYVGEWVAANEAIIHEGYSRLVKTTSGDRMPRLNPNVDRRDQAMKIVLELSKRFGLTTLDRATLLRFHAVLPAGLFDAKQPGQPRDDDRQNDPAPAQPDAIGAMDGFDSVPPDGLPN